MKRVHKKIISWCLGALCAVSVLFGFVAMPAVEASATETAVTAIVQMREGASIRMGDEAIRFQTYVKKTAVTEDAELGVYVIPQDLLGNGAELTNNTAGAKRIAIDKNVWYEETDTHYVYNTVLYDVEPNSYGRQVVARGYVKRGNSYTWANNAQVRSLAYVASATLNDGIDYKGDALSEGQIPCLEGYVDGALTGFALTKDSYTLKVGENQILDTVITSKYLEDYVDNYVVQYGTDNADVATVEDGRLVAKSAGVATITAKLGTRTDTLFVQVNAEQQDVLMSDASPKVNFSIPASYTVTGITCADEDWGTDLSALTVSDELKANKENHGDKVMAIALSNGKTLQVPVTLVTGKISTASEWREAVQTSEATGSTYGHYVLQNDISLAALGNSAGNPVAMTLNTSGTVGFRGTVDGRGFDVRTEASWWTNGHFGALGTGAVLKNISFTQTNSLNYSDTRFLLGKIVFGTKLENVSFNLYNQTPISMNTSTNYGPLAYDGFTKCELENVVVNIENSMINSLFGGGTNTYFGLRDTTFENCEVNVFPGSTSTITELGHKTDASTGTVVYTANGLSIAGATELEGIEVNNLTAVSNVLNAQYVLNGETQSLDLGKYASYTIESMTYNGTTDLGINPSSIIVNEADKTKHGEGNSITVVAHNSEEEVTLTIPVVLVTKVITTVDEFMGLMPTGANGVTYGYYVLGNDIGSADTEIGSSAWFAAGVSALDGANYGFKGTIDGRGHEFTFKLPDAQSHYGLFRFIGTGAVITNITLTNEFVKSQYCAYLLGKSVDGATFDNVTFKLNNVQHRYPNYGVFAQEIVNTTFRNVDIISKATNNIYGNVAVLFTDSGESGNGIFSGNMFENTNVYLFAGASYTGLAKNGTTVYTAEGLEVAGATKLTGITVQPPVPEEESLTDRQELYVEAGTPALDLGEYGAYSVQSIMLGGNSLGIDPMALDLSAIQNNTQLHGEQNIVVTLDKGVMGTALTVPVTLVTKVITTADEFISMITDDLGAAADKLYGYYVLGNDVGDSNTVITAKSSWWAAMDHTGNCGFLGTLDGKGHTFTFSTENANATWGLFGSLGRGAKVKNIALNVEQFYSGYRRYILGVDVIGATFEDVTIYVRNATANNAGLLAEALQDCTFTNVDFITGTLSLLNTNALLSKNYATSTFENCTFHRYPESVSLSLIGVGADQTQYTPADCGIALVNVEEKEVTLTGTQELVLSNDTVALNLGAYRDYDIASITLGAYDLGTDASKLTVSDELKADKQNHGEGKTVVVKASKYADVVSINVPVTLVTAKLSTESEWVSTFMTNTATTVTYGYYVLADDINFTQDYKTTRMNSTTDGQYGFRGSLDGRGHTVEMTSGTTNGLFGELGAGASIKNVTFTAIELNLHYIGHVLGRVAVSTSFTDVTFNLIDLVNSGAVNGALALDGFRACEFTNVEINVIGHVDSIFGGNSNITYWGLNGGNALCEFTNCYVNLMTEESSIGELGHRGDPTAEIGASTHIKYVASNMSTENGETQIEGIMLRDMSGIE